MNKTEIVKAIAEKNDIEKKVAESVIETFIQEITQALINREKVSIHGFGSFESRKRDARTARNPQTGEDIQVPEHFVPAFKAAKALREAVK